MSGVKIMHLDKTPNTIIPHQIYLGKDKNGNDICTNMEFTYADCKYKFIWDEEFGTVMLDQIPEGKTEDDATTIIPIVEGINIQTILDESIKI